MAASLPLELLLEIAKLLRIDGGSLVPCTHVCRYWRAAFEPLVYANLAVYSDCYHKEKGPRGISLTHLQKLTSGSRAIRRNWIRTLEFDMIIPCKLLDWTTRQNENYSTNNQVRQGNDIAFQTAIFDLFQTLHSWNQRCRLSLHLGRRVSRDNKWPIMEPEASHFPTASASHSVDYAGRHLVGPHRARFVKNMTERYLMHVRCIDKLFFLNRIGINPLGTIIIRSGLGQCRLSSNTVQPSLNRSWISMNGSVRITYSIYKDVEHVSHAICLSRVFA